MAATANATPRDVNIFWFGPEWESNNRAALSTQDYFGAVAMARWYGGGAEADAACAVFADLIRKAGRGELLKDAAWGSTPDARLATVLLLDQLARGAFRGTPEAFAYDDAAIETALAAVDAGQDVAMSAAERQFLYTPLMHSESAADHARALKLFGSLVDAFPALGVAKYALNFEKEHAAVVERFGRYPHRNAAKGRTTTPEEAQWLASPDLPSWAKSQLAKA
jgi:uncharacterized protein (DUF924 family)